MRLKVLLLASLALIAFVPCVQGQSSTIDEEIKATKLKLLELNKLKIQELEAENSKLSRDTGIQLNVVEPSATAAKVKTANSSVSAVENVMTSKSVNDKLVLPPSPVQDAIFVKNGSAMVAPTADPIKSTNEKDPTNTSEKHTQSNDSENDTPDYVANQFVQAYFGTEIVGANSATSEAQPYFQLRYNQPVLQFSRCSEANTEKTSNGKKKLCKERNFPLSFWTDMRFAASPSQSLPDFSGLSAESTASFFGSNQSSSVNEFVRSFQIKTGLELGIGHNVSLIAGAGVTSSLSSRKSIQVYKIPRLENGDVLPEFKDIFGPSTDFTGLDNLILTTSERDRFLRNWFFGYRIRFNPYNDDSVHPVEFEMTLGQDEVVTKRLGGGILKFNGIVPLPIPGKFFYFGASLTTRLTRKVNEIHMPFFLEPEANFNLYGNKNLIRDISDTPFETSNRDNYSFRFGIDLVRALKLARAKEAN